MSTPSDLYARLGVNMDRLGCVMLDTAPIDVHDMFPDSFWYYGDLPGRRTGGPEREGHVTLLFGLMENAHTWREYVDDVLEGWEPPSVLEVSNFEIFPGSGYEVVVGRIRNDAELRDAHDRLSRLPHINTFPYKPHITVGYVHQGVGRYVLPDLNRRGNAKPGGFELMTCALNYGDIPA